MFGQTTIYGMHRYLMAPPLPYSMRAQGEQSASEINGRFYGNLYCVRTQCENDQKPDAQCTNRIQSTQFNCIFICCLLFAVETIQNSFPFPEMCSRHCVHSHDHNAVHCIDPTQWRRRKKNFKFHQRSHEFNFLLSARNVFRVSVEINSAHT